MKSGRFTKNDSMVKIVPLGGAGEVTKNMFVYQYGHECVIVDCGLGFPSTEMLGVDFVIPDVSYLLDRQLKVLGLVITHAHEDHIGAIPYIAPLLKAPIFASPLTAAFIKAKLEDFPGVNLRINLIDPDQSLHLGPFKVNFIRVAHSVPDSLHLLIRSPVGLIYHASDFKFDLTAPSQPTDVAKIARFGNEGVLLLLSDCLRAEKPGVTPSEETIKETFAHITASTKGKVLITTTSSNLFRIKQAIEVAVSQGRKVALVGRSVIKAVDIAFRMGIFHFPLATFVELDQVRTLPANQLLLIVAGSQAQPESALSQIANDQHEVVRISKGDSVVFSADPIPGNIDAVYALIDSLVKLGAQVVYSDILDDLHVSGHAAAFELMLLVSLLKPQFVMPISGGFRQMAAYVQLAKQMGFSDDRIILAQTGRVVEVQPRLIKLGSQISLRNVLVDGLGVGDVGSVVLRDRQQIAEDGFVVVIVPVDTETGRVAGKPDIVSRGFVYMNRSKRLIRKAEQIVVNCLGGQTGRITDWYFVRRHIEDNLKRFLYNETKRRPMILPVVIEV